MSFPRVTFKVNKTLDKKMAFEFLDLQRGGINFFRGIVAVHPELKKVKEINGKAIREKFISDYFKSFYRQHLNYLNKRVREADETWGELLIIFFTKQKNYLKVTPFRQENIWAISRLLIATQGF